MWFKQHEAPEDVLHESERDRVRRDFWDAVGSGQCGLVLLVVGVAAAVAAALVAQAHNLRPLATSAWALGVGLGVPAIFLLCLLFAIWCRAMRGQRGDALAALEEYEEYRRQQDVRDFLRTKMAPAFRIPAENLECEYKSVPDDQKAACVAKYQVNLLAVCNDYAAALERYGQFYFAQQLRSDLPKNYGELVSKFREHADNAERWMDDPETYFQPIPMRRFPDGAA